MSSFHMIKSSLLKRKKKVDKKMTDSFIDRCKNIPNIEIDHELIGWAAPSNIALVKYWGKKDLQIPQNPSVSLTLKTCETKTAISLLRHKSTEPKKKIQLRQ